MNKIIIEEIGDLIERLKDLNEYIGESLEIKEGRDYEFVLDNINKLNLDIGMVVASLLVFRKESEEDE
jgi:hypothetical protein